MFSLFFFNLEGLTLIKRKVIYLFFLHFALVKFIYSDCSLKTTKVYDYPAYILENKYIKLIVIPELNGRISEYRLKDKNLFLEFKMEKIEFEYISYANIIKTNYGGYEDWLWEVGRLGNLKYTCEIVEQRKEKCSLKVIFKNPLWKIERLITIYKDSSEVELTVTFTNTSSKSEVYSYWAHTMLSMGDKEFDKSRNNLYIPTKNEKNDEREKRVKPIKDVVKVDSPCIYQNDYKKDVSSFFIPYQGWFGMVNNEKKLILCAIVPIEEVSKDGVYYTWSGKSGLDNINTATMEVIYNSYRFAPFESQEYHLSFVSCLGLDKITYANKYIFINVDEENIKQKDKKIFIPIQMASPKNVNNFSVDFVLTDEEEKPISEVVNFKIGKLLPLKTVFKNLIFNKLDNKENNDYKIKFILYDNLGKVLDENFLLIKTKGAK